MKKKCLILSAAFVFLAASLATASEEKTILFHLKTGLKHDDAQICVAYNMIWASLEEGLKVEVLIDADSLNTFETGWRGKDSIEDFPLPERLRQSLSEEFGVDLNEVPEDYGTFLKMLNKKGADFFVNSTFLTLAKIKEVSADFLTPVTLKEMVELRKKADFYMAY